MLMGWAKHKKEAPEPEPAPAGALSPWHAVTNQFFDQSGINPLSAFEICITGAAQLPGLAGPTS
jgi:hypothetical protein